MKRFPLLLLCMTLAACDDAPPAEPTDSGGYQGGGAGAGTSSKGSGSGQVRVGAGQSSRETITDRYSKALKKINKRDWDGAREELLEALHRSSGNPIQNDIREHLAIVEQGLLAQPTHNVGDVFSRAKNLYEKKLSIRGTFFNGGKVGKVSYYFFVQTGRDRMQVRYPNLELEDKKTILLLKDGARVLVRGTVKSPWGSNPKPYLEANYFRLEKLSPAQQTEMDKEKGATP
jgi:hypothetical protein